MTAGQCETRISPSPDAPPDFSALRMAAGDPAPRLGTIQDLLANHAITSKLCEARGFSEVGQMLDLHLAFAHHLLAFAIFGGLVAKFVLLRAPISANARCRRCDGAGYAELTP
jgi:hypothetical protein